MRRLAALVVALPAAAQAPGWEASVLSLAPALRACLEGQAGAMVVDAWALDGARVTARLLLPGGARQDCVAAGAVESRAPAGMARPGEGLRAFMLERRCVDAWRVTDPDGRELGWLAYPECG
ncbi:hypothetical protein [Falsiroseomonas stagni]|uniref:Uncharacterized protein n=1 Tax=Falsiroseomonas stagni DSM 19981 TaxID=1123062 RepID=A0A1I4BEZ4_9PROT|nr:hypothetical protein [Falsiroseomonas stagni]SFK66860.1 hypothetical protein SAMN02745775_105211 [Falsiroseomonas stagni DSM 19981]